MQSTIYATFLHSENAERAFDELLEQGVSLLDLIVISEHAYQQPFRQTDEGEQEHGCSTSTPVDRTKDEAPCLDPFENKPTGVRILDNLRSPGDLEQCLQVIGFLKRSAEEVERCVLNGGALLIVRLPSGPVDWFQARAAIELLEGTPLAPLRNMPYLG